MGRSTPWGKADHQVTLARGIISYSTPSHGGIWLSPERIEMIKMVLPNVKNWVGGFEWWEEDCDWAVPYVVFADDIRAQGKAYKFEENLEAAKFIIERYHPEIQEKGA